MSNIHPDRECHVLVVDDSESDTRLLREVLFERGFPCSVTTAMDGDEALELLRGEGGTSSRVKPDLIVLDINMPRLNGLDFLKAVRAEPALGLIPVVVFSSSNAPQDVAVAYERRANCFVRKPLGLCDYERAVEAIKRFWFQIATLPRLGRPVSPGSG